MIAAAAAVIGNVVVLFAPRAPSVPTGGLPVDKLVHLLVFAWPTVALIRAGLSRRWVLTAMVVYAAASEVVQRVLLDHRSGDPRDVLADLLGAGIGAWLTRPAATGRVAGQTAGPTAEPADGPAG